mgnify:CR=1 FL=1
MTLVLNNAQVFRSGVFSRSSVSISLGNGVSRGGTISTMDASSFVILPGFVDVHVHLREPGFSYKETIRTGSLAAAHGGYTTVCAMPNLNPVPDSMETLQPELDAIQKDAVIRVLPYGAITKGEQGGELADLDAMAPYVVAFSDDGKGVQDRDMMRRAMMEAKRLGKLIVAHCEDNSLLRGGYIHDGAYAKAHGHRGICSESEWRPIQRDLELVRETGCGYHVCHISTKESVDLIRKAKAEGKQEAPAAPAYITIDDFDKVKFVTAKVLACEAVPKSSKLLRFTLDCGEEFPRQILSGIHEWYEPEALVGKTVVAEAGSAGESAIQDDESLSQADYVSKSVQTDCLMEVAAGTADAAVLDLTLATAMIGEGTDYANLAIKDELNAEEYGVAFRKGSDVAEAVNAAFDELKADGTMQKLADKYSLTLAE